MNNSTFDNITIEYNSGPIPPPFCYKYKIVIGKKDSDQLSIDLKLEYYDRDELTEDEIYDEGFSGEDDFTWSGALPLVWGKEIEQKLKTSNWRKKAIPRPDESEFKIKVVRTGVTEMLYPDTTKIWEVLAQELIQAVFELGKKEAPLNIKFCARGKGAADKEVEFVYSFANQVVVLKPEKNRPESMDWAGGQKLLKYIFGIDYYPEDSFDELPKSEGNYISPGDGFWYELTPFENANKGTVERINKLVETLKGYS